MSDVAKDTERSLLGLIKKRYPSPAFETIPQVRNAAGFDATNTADALVMGTWPSRGLHLHGFEIKCSRSDWLSEIKKPWKADAFQPYCDFWWLVTAPGIVEPGELPEGWGHLQRKGQVLKVVTEAPKAIEVKPVSRTLLAAIVRRHGDPDTELRQRLEAEIFEAVAAKVRKEQSRRLERLQDLEQHVTRFEKASGINVRYDYHGPEKLGEAVKAVLAGDVKRRVQNSRDAVAQLLADMDRIISADD